MTQSSEQQGQRPEKEFRCGTVRAAIWRNEQEQDGPAVAQHSVKITRSYRDQNGEWHEVSNYFPRDLHDVITVAQQAYEYIRLRERDPNEPADDASNAAA